MSPRLTVVSAWIASHVVAFIALVVTPDTTRPGLQSLSFYRGLYRERLTFMDGGWFRLIIDQGYPRGPLPDRMTEWPFFPLYPWLVDAVKVTGFATRPAMILVAWGAALVVLWGTWRLVEPRHGARVATWSVWLLAFAPGSVGLTMTYSDGVFVAGVVWSLVLADRLIADRAVTVRTASEFDVRFILLGATVLVATMSRPNGFLVMFAMLVVAIGSSRPVWSAVSIALPSAVFLGTWMAYANHMTGDALAFMTSKGAWLETTIVDFVTDPFARPAIVFHVVVFVSTAVVAWPSLQRMPLHWLLLAGLLVVPSMILGVEGHARYVFMAVPFTVAMAVRLERLPRSAPAVVLAVSTAALVFLCVNVVRYTWVP